MPTTAVMVLLSTVCLFGQEVLHPAGYSIVIRYDVSADTVTLGDTLTVSRVILNQEAFDLTGLYFGDNLPSEFQVTGFSVSINDTQVDAITSGPFRDSILSGYDTYYWVVDSPDTAEHLQNPLGPADSAVLQLRIVAGDLGDYTLPYHATVFYGAASGFFVTGDSAVVTVTMASGVGDDNRPEGLPEDFLISTAYPNPFNSEAVITYQGNSVRGHRLLLEVFNVLGQTVTRREFDGVTDQGEICWSPPSNLGTGAYYYRVSAGSASAEGKLMLLK
ncbi:MAG: T9SS type A sorting domain-containing protein [bacterium]